MAELGAPQTTKFVIGTAEVRIGPMSMANKLTQANSIGLLNNVQIQVSQDTAELMGGFPQRQVDSAITSESAQLTATFQEFSRRNLNAVLGHGFAAEDSRSGMSKTVKTSASKTDTSLTVDSGGTDVFKSGDLIVVYGKGDPSKVQVLMVKSVSSGTLTLEDDTPLIDDVAKDDIVYLAAPVAVGGVASQEYMSIQLVRQERGTNHAIGWNFWKGTASGGMDLTLGSDDFGSSDMTIKLLEPAVSDYEDSGSPLNHLKKIIPDYPTGMRFTPGD